MSFLFLLISVHLYLKFSPTERFELSVEESERLDFIASRIYAPEKEDKSTQQFDEIKHSSTAKDRSKVNWKSFDPNSANVELFMHLGLDSFIASRIINYREKVKPFYEPEDMLVVYDIDSIWVQTAIPYMDIKLEKPKEKSFSNKKKGKQEFGPNPMKKPVIMVDLNMADTNSLMNIRGIGGYFAGQIVELREALGGFYHLEQLMEVYRMNETAMDALALYSYIDSSKVKKIDLNTCGVEQLGQHPYLSWRQARIIVNYRQQHGNYQASEEILSTDVIPDSVYRKIAPYLSVE